MIFNFKLSWISLTMIASSALLDGATTILLLSMGYTELNPLFYILGYQKFLALFIAFSALSCGILWIADHYLLKKIDKRWKRALIIISFGLAYSVIHYYPGIKQLLTLMGVPML